MPKTAAFYRDVLEWILALQKTKSKRPLFIGLNAPQGAGKTTLSKNLVSRLAEKNLRGLAVSIDDFYLTRKEQIALAGAHPENPFLQQRGYPGTHDVALGERTLQALKDLDGGSSVEIPLYDKSLNGGLGDRAEQPKWPRVSGSLDIVILEGWMLGFAQQSTPSIQDGSLRSINDRLPEYERWLAFLDAFIALTPHDPEYVLKWRVEAEERMKASGKPGLSRDAITAYVQKFLPAYRLWGPQLEAAARARWPVFQRTIGEDRLPL